MRVAACAGRGRGAGRGGGLQPAARRTGRRRAPGRRRVRPSNDGLRIRAASRPRTAAAGGGGRGREPRRTVGPVDVDAGRSSTRGSSPAAGWRRSTRTSPRPVPLSHALFHQRYATNTQPTWRLAQPFRAIAHNGEIDTVRGNREQVRGRSGDAVAGRAGALARALAAAGPLLSPDGSDSQSLDEMIELLVATGWDLGSALLAAMPGRRRCAARRTLTWRRSGGGRPGSSPRGTGRPRSSSPTAAASGRSSIATACDRRPSR